MNYANKYGKLGLKFEFQNKWKMEINMYETEVEKRLRKKQII